MKLVLFSLRDKSTTNICFLPNNMQDLLTHPLQSSGSLPPAHSIIGLFGKTDDLSSIISHSAVFISKLYQHPNLPIHCYPNSRFRHFLTPPACMRLDMVTSRGKLRCPVTDSKSARPTPLSMKESTSGLEVRCSHFNCTNKDLLMQANTDFRKMVFGLYTLNIGKLSENTALVFRFF